MEKDSPIYRALQQHLDRQAVGFPAARSGADLVLLKRVFTPAEAALALHMSFRPVPCSVIAAAAGSEFSAEEMERLLEAMFQKGAIGRKKKNGISHWYLAPLVIGIYEFQDGRPSRRFLRDAGAYMGTLAFAKSFLSVKPSQMRTIPVNKSIRVEHHAAPYDQLRTIIEQTEGPFVVLNCICRERMRASGKPCSRTARRETCLALNSMAAMTLERGHGREISREQALAVLEENEADGLVFQPSGAQHPEFVCSCCGCCCGMLAFQKKLPHPVDFWTSSFFAEVAADKCTACGRCLKRCQVDAVSLASAEKTVSINLSRCLGCGLCVTSCTAEALRLVKKAEPQLPPIDEEALNEAIWQNRKSSAGEWWTLLKAALRLRA